MRAMPWAQAVAILSLPESSAVRAHECHCCREQCDDTGWPFQWRPSDSPASFFCHQQTTSSHPFSTPFLCFLILLVFSRDVVLLASVIRLLGLLVEWIHKHLLADKTNTQTGYQYNLKYNQLHTYYRSVVQLHCPALFCLRAARW